MNQHSMIERRGCKLLAWSLLLILVGCKAAWDSVELPLGYVHQGRKATVIKSPDPDVYLDKLATHELQKAIAEFPEAFQRVADEELAELVLVVSALEGSMTKAKGVAFGKNLRFSKSRTREVPTTVLTLSVYHHDEGLIYEKTVEREGDPNTRMRAVALDALKAYVRGR